jgi:ATP-dependent protease ClpP protease subunit
MRIEYSNKRVEVFAFGTINPYEVNNDGFVSAIALAKAKKCDLKIFIHCMGGSIIEGNLIYNTLLNSEVNITVDIVGICASMATIIMLPATTRNISEDAFLMLHNPSSVVEGDAQTLKESAKVLESMSSIMSKRYAEISGKSIDAVNQLWLNGKDNYLDANEALASGLVDAILPSSKPKNSKTQLQTNAVLIFDTMTAQLNTNKNLIPMKKELIANLHLEGVSENSTDAEIIEAIQKQKKVQTDTIANLQDTVDAIADQNLDAVIDQAIVAEQITVEQKATYKEVGKALGIDKMKAMLPVAKAKDANFRIDSLIQVAGTIVATEDWDAMANKSGALEALRNAEPEKFNALYKAKYGILPTL